MEEYRQSEDIKTVIYTCLFVLLFLGFMICCLYLLYQRSQSENKNDNSRIVVRQDPIALEL